MKLWSITLYNYFGNLMQTVYYTTKQEAEKHRAVHEHYSKVDYAGNFTRKELVPATADLLERSNADIIYLDSYDQYEKYWKRL